MPENKKRLCLRCGTDKEYKEDDVSCEKGHDIGLENYLFDREKEQRERVEADKKKNAPKSLLDNLRRKKS
jgi:hypothetical protein